MNGGAETIMDCQYGCQYGQPTGPNPLHHRDEKASKPDALHPVAQEGGCFHPLYVSLAQLSSTEGECRRWSSDPSGKCSQELLTRGK